MELYTETSPRDFLAVATPGAGKTTFALVLARRLLDARAVERVVVVTPPTTQVAVGRGRGRPRHRSDHHVRPRHRLAPGVHGPALTYAGVAATTPALRARHRAADLVILDEIHHAGDSMSWGEAVREAFAPAERRLSLTGTPFRSDINPIPFISYADDGDGVLRSRADFSYGYGDALTDQVVRPVIFFAYSGEMTWRTSAGDVLSADVSQALPREVTAAAWRTALDPRARGSGRCCATLIVDFPRCVEKSPTPAEWCWRPTRRRHADTPPDCAN